MYVIDTSPLTSGSRLSYLSEAVDHVCKSHDLKRVAIENGAYDAGGRIYELGGANAVSQLVLCRHGVDYRLVAPVQLKKFFSGNHACRKRNMVKEANLRLGRKTFAYSEDDEVDALALALLAYGSLHPATLRHRAAMQVALDIAKREEASTWTPALVTESA